MSTTSAKEALGDSIKKAAKIFKTRRLFFLNEDDILAFLNVDVTKRLDRKGIKMSAHSKVNSYVNNKREFCPDLSISKNIREKNSGKGFDLDRVISIEIKYCFNASKRAVLECVKEDYEQLIGKDEDEGYVLMFDNNSNLTNEDLIRVQKQHHKLNIKIVYVCPKKMLCVMNGKKCELYA